MKPSIAELEQEVKAALAEAQPLANQLRQLKQRSPKGEVVYKKLLAARNRADAAVAALKEALKRLEP